MRVLVGFVNQLFAPELSLGVLDVGSGEFGWVHEPALEPVFRGTRGVNGILPYRGGWAIGFQSRPTRVAIFDGRFHRVAVHELPEVVDLHSFAEHEGRLHCVSTGTDEVFALDLTPGLDGLAATRVYRHPRAKRGHDGHHLNSIASIGGALCVTRFGPKSPNGWSDTVDGEVVRLDGERALARGIHHPHTLRAMDGGFALCESGRGRVWLPDGRRLECGGYVRGLEIAEERIVVGQSGQRLRSRSEGTLNAAVTTRPELARTAVRVHRVDTLAEIARHDLTAFGTEIYEVVALPEAADVSRFLARPARDLRIDAMKRQILDLEERVNVPEDVRDLSLALGRVRRSLGRAAELGRRILGGRGRSSRARRASGRTRRAR